ncbi:MAG: hypothetical protein MK052_09415, partial [Alphaproteobacteria bacterium]|nr:hypothetical protein [Alphaproteobacteria bacterium]
GLAHPHSDSFGTDVLISALDDERATVMSYNNYVNSTGRVFYVETPQIYDILALQVKYGANTSYNSGNTVYDLASTDYSKFAGTTWDGGGVDVYDARGITTSVTLDLREGLDNITSFNTFGFTSSGSFSNLTYIWNAFGANIENAYGGSSHDVMHGNDMANVLIGYEGNDNIIGYSGNDTINGHSGNDSVNGHFGNDTLRGGAGDDVVRGGADNDTLRGDKGNDVVRGDKGNDIVLGDDGNDYVNGHEGADIVRGGAGNDVVRGGSENDIVIGDTGDDVVDGDRGDDVIDGGAGRDVLFGSQGADRFVFFNRNDSTDSARDLIGDFTAEDVIDLSSLGFSGIREGSSTGTILGYMATAVSTIVEASGSDFGFELVGNISLSDADFIFN